MNNNNDNTSRINKQIAQSVHYQNFIKHLVKKTSNGQVYYYYRINSPVLNKSKQVYIGKYSEQEEQLIEYYIKQLLLETTESFSSILTTTYDNQYITPPFAILLDLLSYTFYFSQKDFAQSDLERYEQATFTKYVHGTTSVEGNTYTHRQTDLTLNQGQTIGGKDRREFYEIDNYRKWKNYLDQHPEFSIDMGGITTIHEYLLADIDPYITPGDFRHIEVVISGTDARPTPAILIEQELEELLAWYEDNKHRIHPVELIARFHEDFERIHPFNDGNGRVGREIMRLQLKAFGYSAIFINNQVRASYLQSLDQSGNGDYTEIVSFIASLVLRETMASLQYYSTFMQDVLNLPQFAPLQKIIDQHPQVRDLLDAINNELSEQISEFVATRLDKIQDSEILYLDHNLVLQLEEIIAKPLSNLRIEM